MFKRLLGNFKTRPEAPELDNEQTADLRTFFEGQSTQDLEKALNQLQEDSLKDQGPYPEGGVPGNVNRAFGIIRSILDNRGESGGGTESRG